VSLSELLSTVPLIDHHVHGALRADPSRELFESTITESDRPAARGVSSFESPVGFAILRFCSPLLGLEGEVSSDEYFARRIELGADEVNRRFLTESGVATFLVDTGFNAGDVQTPEEMALCSGKPVHEVVRLEALAQRLLDDEVSSSDFADRLASELENSVRAGVVGTKSILAYRAGFDIDTARPSAGDLQLAVDRQRRASTRIDDPVVLAHLLWAGVEARVPLQIHTGFGDTDLTLHQSNPSLLTPFLRASEATGTPVVLLHCYPYHREAGYLAQMFPHVYFDVGEAINYAGAQGAQVVAETFALAPFAKQLFSSDGWGPVELHFLGAHMWRRAIDKVLGGWVRDGDWSTSQAERVLHMVGYENARRIYPLRST
jgi:hypothetical protein